MKKNILSILIISILLLASCQVQPQNQNNQNTNTQIIELSDTYEPNQEFNIKDIEYFKTQEELEYFLAQTSQNNNNFFPSARAFAADDMAFLESASTVENLVAVKSQGGEDFSQTNNQVANVDEADIIKTDGKYIYTITDQTVFIVDAYPPKDADIISEIQVKNAHPTGMFITEDKLIVYGHIYSSDRYNKVLALTSNSMTFVNIYDITDKENIELVKEYVFEGNPNHARMVDDHAYIITQTYPNYGPYPMPLIIEDDIQRTIPVDSIFYYPQRYDNPTFVTINAFDLDDNSHASKTMTLESAQYMYMSQENIYLAYTTYVNEWQIQNDVMIDLVTPKLEEKEKLLVQKIQNTDSEILSHTEKQNKVLQLVTNYMSRLSNEEAKALEDLIQKETKRQLDEFDHFEHTVLTKIEVDKKKITIKATGKIFGSLNNQFSMDEYDNVLRVATTLNQRWSSFTSNVEESSNNVFTLDKNLNMLDSKTGIAKTERIFSTRFIQDKLYMVTFRQVDPFFVIDLKDPENINVLGELKIPGFSRYLHPYDETTIIGIGRDATLEGRTQGLKISLFDVKDVTNPKEVASYISNEKYVNSAAEYEHKAFLFSKEKNMLVIPAYSYDYENQDSFNGAFVFHITKQDITLRGLIDHSNNENWWSPQVERSLYIEEYLYTKSRNLLRINNIEDLEGVKDIDLKAQNTWHSVPVY